MNHFTGTYEEENDHWFKALLFVSFELMGRLMVHSLSSSFFSYFVIKSFMFPLSSLSSLTSGSCQ